MMKNRGIWILVFLVCSITSMAQEGLAPLAGNEALQLSSTANYAAEANSNYSYSFAFDTNHLPITDDFSRNYFKQYKFDTANTPTDTLVWNRFLMNGEFLESFEAMFDTSFVFTYDSVNQNWDSVASPVVYITTYSLTDYQMPIDTDTVWARQDTLIRNDSIIMTHPYDRLYQNFTDTVIVVSDVGLTYWRNNNALHNYSYSNTPPTLGMVTFDGLDSTGVPYDPTMNPNSYQIADILESKPIFLKTHPSGGADYDFLSDTVYLSFQYQPQGLGDAPEPEDSLVLEFYSPFTDQWHYMWSAPGDTVRDFRTVMIWVKNPIFFMDGFKFRFLNYASVSGNFDHWNIDYVRLDEDRFAGDSTIHDVGLMDPGYSLLENYYQMPWRHYKESTKNWMKTEQFIRYRNQGTLSYTAFSQFDAYDEGSLIFSGSQGIDPQFGPLETGGQVSLFNDEYPRLSADSVKTYEVEYISQVDPDNNPDNDKFLFNQQFGSQYAYDDGSAEAAYYVKSANAQIAIEYEVAILDSLRALNIYFPRSFTNIIDRPYRVMVWKSLNPEIILYEGFLENPTYSGGRDLVQRVNLEEPIEVEGVIYVGIKQLDDVVYVGMDRNTNSKPKNFYNVQGSWFASEFEGSIFIRPEFGDKTLKFPVATEEVFAEEVESFLMYPNPASSTVTIQANSDNNQIVVRSMLGVVVRDYEAGYSSTFETSNLPTGLYLVEQLNLDTQSSTIKKLLIQH